MNEVRTLVHQVGEARSRVLQTVRTLSEQQASFKSTPEAWSINEMLEHLVLAEQYGVSKIWSAAAGVKSGRPAWTGEHTNAGRSIDDVIAQTWKEKEVAPSFATPHMGGPLLCWAEYFRLGQPMLEKLGDFLEGMDLRKVIYPHFLSGPLDAGQRIDFVRFHMDRHRSQIEKTIALPTFPSA